MHDSVNAERWGGAAILPATPTPGGQRLLEVQVVGRAPAARNAVTFWLAQPGMTRAPAPYCPGQFITLAFNSQAMPLALGTDARSATRPRTLYRSYSLCGDGDPDQPWEITVKRQQAGLVSGLLFDHVTPGTLLRTTRPAGTFTLPVPLDPALPLVFIAAGSGITPLYGMLRALARVSPRARPQVHLHYAYRNAEDAIYGQQLAQLDPRRSWLHQWHYRSARQQRLTSLLVTARLQDQQVDVRGTHWYVCGPEALKHAMLAAAERSGVPRTNLHAEVFTSAQRAATSPGTPGTPGAWGAWGARGMPAAPMAGMHDVQGATPAAAINVAETGDVLDVQATETLLDALERHGYEPNFSCRAGACGTCRMRLLAGRVSPRGGDPERALTDTERSAGYIVTCSTRPVGQVTLALAGFDAPASTAPAALAASAVPFPTAMQTMQTMRPRPSARRAATQRRLRWGVAAASIALFASVWGLTDHRAAASASSSGFSLPSLPSLSFPNTDDGGNGDGNPSNTSSSQSPSSPSTNGPSWFNPRPGSSQPNTSSGVS